MTIRLLLEKYRDIILYLFFGVCTTLVNILSYYLCAHPLRFNVMVSTVIAWILAVLFAYLTNRTWVFHSSANTHEAIVKEIVGFFGCRLATGVLDWGCMLLFVEILGFHDVLIKSIANVLVIILNYVASKLVIFRGKGNVN